MSLFSKSGSLIRNTMRKERIDHDLSEEVGSYVELLTEKNMKEGMSETEARRAALIKIGGVEQVKEEVRSGRAGFAIETFFQDLRYGFRSLRKKPGFTLTAIIALALGIGANTAIFSVINGVLLRSLDYARPDRIVMIWERFAQNPEHQNVVSPANFLDWQKTSRSFEKMAAVWDLRQNITGSGDPIEVHAQFVSAGFFPTLGVRPFIGRWFTDEEDRPGGNLVAILSHKIWQERFGGDNAVLGQQVPISGRLLTIVGVMPPGFHFLNDEVQIWRPIAFDPAQDYRKTSGRFLKCVGRLAPGATLEQAQSELNVIASQLAQQYPSYNATWSVSLTPIREQIVGDVRHTLLVLLAAVAFVLLIACANVANLLLARAASRQRELALRAALGATRNRLLRQLLTESVLLALCGGMVGIALAYWGVELLKRFGPDNIPRLHDISIDPRVLLFTFAISLLTGIAFGLVPALQASRADVNDALKEGARGSTGGRGALRNLFVVAEVSLALVLLIGAGLMIRSFMRLHQVKTGFESNRVLTMRVQLPGAKYKEDQQRLAFFKQAQERISSLPGVKVVGSINFLPLTGMASNTAFHVVGQPQAAPGQEPGTEVRVISGAYFGAMGIPLLKGRLFDEHDGPDSRVTIINETMARKYFPNEDPIGKQLSISWAPPEEGKPQPIDEIIGVVGDTRETALDHDPNPAIYWPLDRESYQFMTFIIRSAIEPTQLVASVQREIRAMDPDQPLADVRTLEQVVAKSIARPRFDMMLLGIFAAVALVLASVGLYGVMNYSATQRTQEIGIRMALGAKSGDILRLVVGHGMKLTFAGIVIGIIASLALTRVMTNLLFGVTATDLTTFFAVSTMLTVVALLANYIPARRVTRINPVVALRYE
ncbi:MAG: ADOP family duplicated permease [Chthoniobacterales bacterium]